MKRRSFLKLSLFTIPAVSFAKVNLFSLKGLEKVEKVDSDDKLVSDFLNSNNDSEEVVFDKPLSEEEILLTSFLKEDIHLKRGNINYKDARRLHLYNPHTKEVFKKVYFSNGKYKNNVLKEVNYFMRDFRENKTTNIDKKLVDLIYSLQKTTSPDKPLKVLSGYRTKRTNKIVKGAKHSQHMAGKAVDIAPLQNTRYKLTKIKKQAKKQKVGGVGFYSRRGFVHVDTGAVRYWS